MSRRSARDRRHYWHCWHAWHGGKGLQPFPILVEVDIEAKVVADSGHLRTCLSSEVGKVNITWSSLVSSKVAIKCRSWLHVIVVIHVKSHVWSVMVVSSDIGLRLLSDRVEMIDHRTRGPRLTEHSCSEALESIQNISRSVWLINALSATAALSLLSA